jgi:putative ABC transport system permease protein
MYESKATVRAEFSQYEQMFLLVGGVLCTIIALVGILNFFNSIMTGILSRRREFAVIQSVGMTSRQLRAMLIYEGLFYALSSVSAALILSLVLEPLAGKVLASMYWFYDYHFTIFPVLLTIPVFVVLGVLIPMALYGQAARQSVVERLREAE